MPNATCPPANELGSYALGRLEPQRSEEIDAHLLECGECQAELATCGNADDTFLARLREPDSADPFFAEAECAQLVIRLADGGLASSFPPQDEDGAAESPSESLGDVGPYRLLEKLGAGGMGTVYKALHTRLKRVVALKMLPVERTEDSQAVARFEREMEAVGQLSHPNIVLAHDAGEADGKHFLVMEYVEGRDLAELVRGGPLPIADACELIRQAAVGLQHAHENGLVHRDLKPSNLMLDGSGTVKILDLGLALLPESQAPGRELTSTGQAMGTLDYMAPEQGGDSHDVDIRADIYSLGATLYKLLTGTAVFSGPLYQSPVQKFRALAMETAPPVQDRRAEVSDRLAAVVHRMLQPEKEDRYATPQLVAEALAEFSASADLPGLLAACDVDEVLSAAQLRSGSTTSLRQVSASIITSSQSKRRPAERAVASRSPGASPVRRRGWLLLGVALGLFGALAAAAAVFTLQTPQGTIEIRLPDGMDGSQIAVIAEQGGKVVKIANAANRWTITLADGEYQLDIRGGGDQLALDKDQVTVRRNGKVTVAVTLTRPELQPASVAGQPAIGPLDSTGRPLLLPPVKYTATEPLNRHALVLYPTPIEGLRSWTVDTKLHRGALRDLTFSRDGEYLAFVADGAIRILDGESFDPVRTLMCPRIGAIAWLADSRTISVLERKQEDLSTLHLWDATNGRLIERIDLPLDVGGIGNANRNPSMAWSGDDRLAVTSDVANTVVVYDRRQRKIVATLAHKHGARGVAWSPDDKLLAVSTGWRMPPFLSLWDASNYERLHELSGAEDPTQTDQEIHASGPVWLADGKMVVCAFTRGRIVGWDAASGERKLVIPAHTDYGSGPILSRTPNPQQLVAAADTLEVIDLATGRVSKQIDEGDDRLGHAVCSPKTGRVLLASGLTSEDLIAIRLDKESEKTNLYSDLHDRMKAPEVGYDSEPGFQFTYWSPDVERPALPGDRGTLRGNLYDAKLVTTADGKITAQVTRDGAEIAVWRAGDLLLRLSGADQHAPPYKYSNLALQPDGTSVIARCSDGRVRAWQMADGALLAEIDVSKLDRIVRFLACTPERQCVLLDNQGTVAVTGKDFANECQVISPRAGNDGAFSPGGRQLAIYGGAGVRVFDVQTLTLGKPLMAPARNEQGHCRSIAWRNDRTLALFTNRDHILLFDTVTNKELRRYPFPWARHPFFSTYTSLFGAAGRTFVTSRWGGDKLILDTTNGALSCVVYYQYGNYLRVGMTGHWEATAAVAQQVMYVAETDAGDQLNLSPAEFQQRFGWQNDPRQVVLASPTATSDLGKLDAAGEPIQSPPVAFEATEPLSDVALVPYPTPVPGARSWTVDTRMMRNTARVLQFSPDGKYLGLVADGAVRIMDGATLKPVRSFMRPNIVSIAWLADSRTISVAEGNENGTTTFHLWDVRDGHLVDRFELSATLVGDIQGQRYARVMDWSPENCLAARMVDSKQVLVYDLKQRKIVRRLDHPREILGLAWSPNGKHLATISSLHQLAGAWIWDAERWELAHDLDARYEGDRDLKDQHGSGPLWTADGTTLLAGYRQGVVLVWDAETGERKQTIQKDSSGCPMLCRTPDSQRFLISCEGIDVVDIASGKAPRELSKLGYTGDVVCHPHSGQVLVTSVWFNQDLWSIDLNGGMRPDALASVRSPNTTPERTPFYWPEGLSRPVTQFGFTRTTGYGDGRLVATRNGNTTAQRDIHGGHIDIRRRGEQTIKIRMASDAQYRIGGIALQPDGSAVAAICSDNKFRAWELPSAKLLAEIDVPTTKYSNKFVYCTEDRRLVLVDPDDKVIYTEPNFGPQVHTASPGVGRDAALSPDTRRIAFYGGFGVCYFDLHTGKISKPLYAPGRFDGVGAGQAFCIAWRDDQTLALLTNEGSVVLADADNGSVLRSYPCPWARQPFSSTIPSMFGATGRYYLTHLWGNAVRILDTTNGAAESIIGFENQNYLRVGMTGHWESSPPIAGEVIYIVETNEGDQLNLTPAEFQQRFGWQNDPTALLPGSSQRRN